MPVPSNAIELGRITAGQVDIGVWVPRAVSAVAWGRCHLVLLLALPSLRTQIVSPTAVELEGGQPPDPLRLQVADFSSG